MFLSRDLEFALLPLKKETWLQFHCWVIALGKENSSAKPWAVLVQPYPFCLLPRPLLIEHRYGVRTVLSSEEKTLYASSKSYNHISLTQGNNKGLYSEKKVARANSWELKPKKRWLQASEPCKLKGEVDSLGLSIKEWLKCWPIIRVPSGKDTLNKSRSLGSVQFWGESICSVLCRRSN